MDDWKNVETFQVIGLTLNIVGAFFFISGVLMLPSVQATRPAQVLGRPLPEIVAPPWWKAPAQLAIGFVFILAGYFLQVAYHLSLTITDRSNVLTDPSVMMVAAILIASITTVTLLLKGIQILLSRRNNGHG